MNETRFQYFRSDPPPRQHRRAGYSGPGRVYRRRRHRQPRHRFAEQLRTPELHFRRAWHPLHAVRRSPARRRLTTVSSPSNFNGTFTFSSHLGAVPARAIPSQFTIARRHSRTSLSTSSTRALLRRRLETAAEPDAESRPSLRSQTNIHDRATSRPAWPLPGRRARPVRSSAKPYSRAASACSTIVSRSPATLTAARYNGVVQQQYVVTNPDFYPHVPSLASLAASRSPQTVQTVDSRLRAPYILQSALTLERQLPKNTTLALTYTNSHGLHVLRSLDIPAPRTVLFT